MAHTRVTPLMLMHSAAYDIRNGVHWEMLELENRGRRDIARYVKDALDKGYTALDIALACAGAPIPDDKVWED
jgi:hypothetical protein